MERLERRVVALESIVRELAGNRTGGQAASGAAGQLPPSVRASSAPPSSSSGPAARPSVRQSVRPSARLPIGEQWIGQRGLLAVGVFALLLAAGYLLKLSFDRNWIPPVARCAGGALVGVMVGAIGWRLHSRYRVYGAALIGCGAGIVYLSVWAASRLYQVLPPTPGIVGLALVSVALAMIAYAIDVEALGATAALGAFLAPVLLGHDRSNADLLLLYLGSMAAGLGLVSAKRRWRFAMFVIAASYFGIGTAGAADRAVPWAVLLYGVIGGTTGLYIGLRERWWETRLLTFSGGWAFLAAARDRLTSGWPVLAAGMILSAPIWRHGLRNPRVLPLRIAPQDGGPGWSMGEALYFFVTPLLLGWALHAAAPAWLDMHRGAVPLLIALPYLAAGYARPLMPFALVGAAALGIAAEQHWSGVAEVWALLLLTTTWAALDHLLGRTDGRWYALVTLAVALRLLFADASDARTAADPAFVDRWALALWGATAVAAALAAGLWRVPAAEEPLPVRRGLWALAGVMALFGVTGEIRRYFGLQSLSAETAELASGLAVSAWWLVFAATLVTLGFRRGLRPARLAGLCVAGLAVIKVIFFDLSSLDALYRVGSVFLLGLVTLSLAYLYYRHDRPPDVREGDAAPGL
jgi:uncharacterized membrane protein